MRKRTLSDSYHFPSFKPKHAVSGIFGDPYSRVVNLVRQGKKLSAASVGRPTGRSMTERSSESVTFLAAIPAYTWNWKYGASGVRGAGK